MVKPHAKKLIVNHYDGEHDKCASRVCCSRYGINFGYIIRVIWRLAAVCARFVIFALIWVVLGGACMCYAFYDMIMSDILYMK